MDNIKMASQAAIFQLPPFHYSIVLSSNDVKQILNVSY